MSREVCSQALCSLSLLLLVGMAQGIWITTQTYTSYHFCPRAGKPVYFAYKDKEVARLAIEGEVATRWTVPNSVAFFAVSPDCSRLVAIYYSEDGRTARASIINSDTGAQTVLELGKMDIAAVAVGNNARIYLFPPKENNGPISPICAADQQEPIICNEACNTAFANEPPVLELKAKMHPSGKWIYVSTRRGNMHRFAVTDECLRFEALPYDRYGAIDYGDWWYTRDGNYMLTENSLSLRLADDVISDLLPTGRFDTDGFSTFKSLTQAENQRVFGLPVFTISGQVRIKAYSWPRLQLVGEVQVDLPTNIRGMQVQNAQALGNTLYVTASYINGSSTVLGISTINVANVNREIPMYALSGQVTNYAIGLTWMLNNTAELLEFCTSADLAVFASLFEHTLVILDANTQTIRRHINLDLKAQAMTFTSDCQRIYVAHFLYVSSVNLNDAASQPELIHVPELYAGASSISSGSNNVIYLFGIGGTRKICFNVQTRQPSQCEAKCVAEQESMGVLKYGSIFTLEKTPSTNVLKKYRPTSSCMEYERFANVLGNAIWSTQEHVFMDSGEVFNFTDLRLLATFNYLPLWLAFQPAGERYVLLAQNDEAYLVVLRQPNLGLRGAIPIPMPNCSYVMPRQVHFDAKGNLYVYGTFYLMQENTYKTGISVWADVAVDQLGAVDNNLKMNWEQCRQRLMSTNQPWWLAQRDPGAPSPTKFMAPSLPWSSEPWQDLRTSLPEGFVATTPPKVVATTQPYAARSTTPPPARPKTAPPPGGVEINPTRGNILTTGNVRTPIEIKSDGNNAPLNFGNHVMVTMVALLLLLINTGK